MPAEETLTVAISPALREKLDTVAEARATTVGEIVRTAVLSYLVEESDES